MIIKLWTGNWKTQLNRMNQKLDEENRKALNKRNLWYREFHRFFSNKFWKNIGCLISDHTFGIGGVKAVEEGRWYKVKWKEEEDSFNSYKG